jgi:REP element-mobilizing transposase RayT
MNFQILELNLEPDYIEALIQFPPKLSMSQTVNAPKGLSSLRYGQAGYPKPYGVLVTLYLLLGVRHLKSSKNTSFSKGSKKLFL